MLRANAKLNLALAITGVYPDGYHALEMLNISVDAADEITLSARADERINCDCSMYVPDEVNTAVLAAAKFCKEFGTPGADISIRKGIPAGAGMGGSSADAAGVIAGLAELYGITDSAALKELAAGCGSDTSFMLRGGAAWVSGRGEVLEPLQCRHMHFVLLCGGHVSTAQAYARFDAEQRFKAPEKTALIDAYQSGDLAALNAHSFNALEDAARGLSADVGKNIALLNASGAEFVRMTGSGGGVFGAFQSKEAAARAHEKLSGSADVCLLLGSAYRGIDML